MKTGESLRLYVIAFCHIMRPSFRKSPSVGAGSAGRSRYVLRSVRRSIGCLMIA